MVGTILPMEGLAWLAGAIFRRAWDSAGGAPESMALQGVIFGLPRDARMRFRQRKRGETEMPFAFREALLALGRKAYPQMGETVLDSLTTEGLLALARESGIVLPFAEGMGIMSLKVAQEIQGHKTRQHWPKVEAWPWWEEDMVAVVCGRGTHERRPPQVGWQPRGSPLCPGVPRPSVSGVVGRATSP